MGNQQLGIRITEPHGIRFVEHRYAVVVSQNGRTKLIRHYVDPESVLFDLISSNRLRSKAMLSAEIATARNRGRLREYMERVGARPTHDLEVIEEKARGVGTGLDDESSSASAASARPRPKPPSLTPPELGQIDNTDLQVWASPAPEEAGVGDLYDLLDLDALAASFSAVADSDAFNIMFRQQRVMPLSSTEYDVVVSAWEEVKIEEVVVVMLSFGAQSTLGMFGGMLRDYQAALNETSVPVIADTNLQDYASEWYGARYARSLTDHWLVPRSNTSVPPEAFENFSAVAKAVVSVRQNVLKEVSDVFYLAQHESDQRAAVFLALSELTRKAVHESRAVASNDEWAFVPRHLLDKMDALLTTLAEATHAAEEEEASASHVNTQNEETGQVSQHSDSGGRAKTKPEDEDEEEEEEGEDENTDDEDEDTL